MSAGARIIKPGGTLILACECREGVPGGSPLDKLLRSASSPEEILAMLATPGFVRPEQWQAQIQALVQRKAKVLVYSSLPDEVIRAAHLTPVSRHRSRGERRTLAPRGRRAGGSVATGAADDSVPWIDRGNAE
jgi:nickel-dependent lactate racemase